jgi:hypothetical protein
MDLGSALILDHKVENQYYVQIATKEYCSPKFWDAFKNQTPLNAQDLIQEDHYQILSTLDAVCKGRMDLTEETKFMLEILRGTNTIEDALLTLSRKLELMHKLFNVIRNSKREYGKFALSLLRNLDIKG